MVGEPWMGGVINTDDGTVEDGTADGGGDPGTFSATFHGPIDGCRTMTVPSRPTLRSR